MPESLGVSYDIRLLYGYSTSGAHHAPGTITIDGFAVAILVDHPMLYSGMQNICNLIAMNFSK
jgi:hypothetical protein